MEKDLLEFKKLVRISDSKMRAKFAQELIEENSNLNFLIDWIHEDVKLANRSMWLLSDIGALDKSRLEALLPTLFAMKDKVHHVSVNNQLARYLMITGIPADMEDECAELLFSLIRNASTTPHYRQSAEKALEPLLKKYPELRNELETT